jgi:hypothetical protein
MRTLQCSRGGTSGPGMELFKAGLDSKRTACAKADAPSRSDAAATKNRNASRIRRPAYIAAFFANCGEANDVMHVQFCERSPVSHRHMRLPCFSTNTQSKSFVNTLAARQLASGSGSFPARLTGCRVKR